MINALISLASRVHRDWKVIIQRLVQLGREEDPVVAAKLTALPFTDSQYLYIVKRRRKDYGT